MRNRSVKWRIGLYYSASTLLVVALMLGFLLVVISDLVVKERTENLVAVTERTYEDISISGGSLVVDKEISYSGDGAFVVLTDKKGKVIDGALGSAFTDSCSFQQGKVRKITSNGERYYIYDIQVKKGEVNYWLRGVTSAEFSEMAPSLNSAMKKALTILPFLLLLIIWMGWFLTNRAFKPLRSITETAELIQKEGDLSRRIGLTTKGKGDEITHTAEVFDGMLGRIEENFQREKRFTDDAGHELRTPTAVVMAECEYALANIEDIDEVEASLKTILAQSRQMSRLISTLLTFARADRGVYELDRSRCDLGLLAEEVCDRYMRFAEEKEIKLQIDTEEESYADCDESLITRALENLLSNGFKYSRPGGHLLVTVRRKKKHIAITVEDDGIGIAPEELPKIWNRFYRAENAVNYTDTAGDDESIGLGLPLVKWIVETHGGSIQCTSTLGEGTRFDIKIPCVINDTLI